MTDSEIIDRLGGTASVARALNLDMRVVSNWRKRNISGVGRYKITELAKTLAIRLPKNFMREAGQ